MRQTRFDTLDQELAFYKKHLSGFNEGFEQAIKEHFITELEEFHFDAHQHLKNTLPNDLVDEVYWIEFFEQWKRDRKKYLDGLGAI